MPWQHAMARTFKTFKKVKVGKSETEEKRTTQPKGNVDGCKSWMHKVKAMATTKAIAGTVDADAQMRKPSRADAKVVGADAQMRKPSCADAKAKPKPKKVMFHRNSTNHFAVIISQTRH